MFKKYILASLAMLAIVVSLACSSSTNAGQQTATHGQSSPDAKPKQSNSSTPAEKEEPLNGIPTGDSYVLIVFNGWSEPNTGKFYRDNEKLEKLGFRMDPNTFHISQGYGASSITAVYHKVKVEAKAKK